MTTYDLTGVRKLDNPAARRVTQGILAVLAIGAAIVVIDTLINHGLSAFQNTEPAATFFVGLIASLGALWGFLLLAPGPVTLTLENDSLSLIYRTGRVRSFDLARPDLQITVWQYPETRPDGRPNLPPLHYIVGGIPFRNPITPESFAALTQVAHSRGLSVTEEPRGSGSSQRFTKIHIRSAVTNV
jgi:hypothetical protein